MITIWKYPFQIADHIEIRMPYNAKIISAQMQGKMPCLWAIVNDEEDASEKRRFMVYGTGHPAPRVLQQQFVASLQDGGFVWHLFETT